MKDNTKKVLQGFLIGAAAGVVAGLLLAPSSGKETRKKIADSAKDLSDKFGNEFDDAMSKLSSFTETTLSNLKNAKSEKVSSN
ncbi:YtxH domain-containing protein [Xanthocytophaga agilis]|uniref:YtxH domain-containing protein n=1 Tax=Xanthocytophaga agilis TaxID=3048010 RepID=A0AAE3R666_9BACT|nr:YtxH domain-containing protein [Xanthocytophaga agilis]MDJ1502204.1 YtxH domain-containing protein [Xanthocytophaga agilis]